MQLSNSRTLLAIVQDDIKIFEVDGLEVDDKTIIIAKFGDTSTSPKLIYNPPRKSYEFKFNNYVYELSHLTDIHPEMIYYVTWYQDNRNIIVAYNNSITMWTIKLEDPGIVTSVPSPKKIWTAIIEGATINMQHISNIKQNHQLNGHKFAVQSICWSDDYLFASGGADKTIKIWQYDDNIKQFLLIWQGTKVPPYFINTGIVQGKAPYHTMFPKIEVITAPVN